MDQDDFERNVINEIISSDGNYKNSRSLLRLIDKGFLDLRWLRHFILELKLLNYPIKNWLPSFHLKDGELGCRIHSNLFAAGNSLALAVIPLSFFDLKELKWLTIDTTVMRYRTRQSQFSILPDNISKLKNLRRLHLTIDELEQLPESIGDLKNLEALIIDKGRIEKIPSSLLGCTRLKELRISNTLLSELPEFIFKMQNLTTLDLSKNNIEQISVPEKIKWNKMVWVNISGNPIKETPSMLADIKIII